VPPCPLCGTAQSGRFCEACGCDFALLRPGADGRLTAGPGLPSLIGPGVGAPSVSPPQRLSPPSHQWADAPPPADPCQSAIESADAAVKRSSEPAIFDQLVAGGAVAASFTAAASVAKAKVEATTQRRKNELDAEVRREEIAAQERQAALHEREETKRARRTGRSGPAPRQDSGGADD
jgi:hypothetical protein